MDEKWVNWSHGAFAITPTAGMLTDLVFHLDGTRFRPLARAPWLDDSARGSWPSSLTHLGVLGGEFPCVPFGADHGYGANAPWQLECDDDEVRARIDYPRNSPVRRLERRVRAVSGEPRVDLELTVEARTDTRLPIGVHPILRLPMQPGALGISADFVQGYTHPSRQRASQVTTHGSRFTDLASVPAPGGRVDLTRLPLPSQSDPSRAVTGVDDGGMLCGVRSPLTVRYFLEHVELVLDWDDHELPSVNYWYSDCGIEDPPWNGRYRGLGIEPACSYFDYGVDRSTAPNSLTAAGVATNVRLRAGAQLTIAYSLTARPCPAVTERAADAHRFG